MAAQGRRAPRGRRAPAGLPRNSCCTPPLVHLTLPAGSPEAELAKQLFGSLSGCATADFDTYLSSIGDCTASGWGTDPNATCSAGCVAAYTALGKECMISTAKASYETLGLSVSEETIMEIL